MYKNGYGLMLGMILNVLFKLVYFIFVIVFRGVFYRGFYFIDEKRDIRVGLVSVYVSEG